MNNKVAIHELFDKLFLIDRYLTAGQSDYINGCKKYYKKNNLLTPKQVVILREIASHTKVPTRSISTVN